MPIILALFAAPVLATGQGNNGTLKVHEAGTPSGTESNDPKVCEFNFEGFGFDAAQGGYIVVDGQGQTDAPAALTLAFGPTDTDGFYATEYVNSDGGAHVLAAGHYKATLYGKDTGGTGPNLDDEKAKSKVFKVECETDGGDGGGGGGGGGGEGCPSPTQLLVTFNWNGSAFEPVGGNAMGVEVTGNADQAFWKSSQVISALVITAGGVTYNIALDFPETVGSVSPDNYSVFGGAPMDALAFCVGEKTRPDTTTSGPSVELSKTAECATVGDDGMATVTGTITADLDSHRPARITSALDTILAPGDIALHMETVGLVGEVLTVADDEVTIAYSITFDQGEIRSFDNFIEVTLEDAETGEDRHKIYNARAAFELCDEGEETLGSITIIKDANPNGAQDFAFTTSGTGLSDFSLDDDGDATLPSEWSFMDLEAGTYTVTETEVDGWTLTSITCSTGGTGDANSATATITLEAGAHVTCTFLNTQDGEGVSPGNPPGEGTQGGNPVPDTALAPITASPITAVLALLALLTLGAVGALTAVQVRSRR